MQFSVYQSLFTTFFGAFSLAANLGFCDVALAVSLYYLGKKALNVGLIGRHSLILFCSKKSVNLLYMSK
jgi:hypothetical protein